MRKILTTIFLLTIFSIPVYAEVASRSENLDTSLANTENIKYADPQKILLTQVTTSSTELENDPEKWFKSLYYHSITRGGFPDIPFSYVVTRDGQIFEGHSGGDGAVPEILGDEGAFIVGYLSNASDITVSAKVALEELIEDLSAKYGIQKGNVQVVELEKNSVGEEVIVSKVSYTKSNSQFKLKATELINTLNYKSVGNLSYKTQIVKVDSVGEVKAGAKMKITLELKNVNDFAWFTDKDYIYVSTKGDKDSDFAVNGVWDSFSKPIHIENKTILPGETVTLQFDMYGGFFPGEYAEEFNVKKLDGEIFSESSFKVNMKVTAGDFDLVRIEETPTGYLNVRSCASTGFDQIATVDTGRTLVLREEEGSWYKVEYEDGKTGWVYAGYAQKL
jgi:hypothetical protein